ncbi:MAG: GNAT family N-acetyltransferase [Oscillospiraceae bacterium]|nr:GNAT family N-acetyltransferase [Oscillospiraceae bacterium]
MNISIRKGNIADTERMLQLLHKVKDGMENDAWFFLDPDEEIRGMMESGVMQLWLAEDGDRVAAIFDYIVPGLNSYNYGYDLGLSEEQLLRVVQMDTAAVDPDYRGLKLQKTLMQRAEREIREVPGRILLSTIHPDNCYSLNNLLAQDYFIAKKVAKYGSVRYVLRKDLP